MEERKTNSKSGYLHEDEFSYVTQDHEVFLKGGSYYDERKLCDIDQDPVDEKVQTLKSAFADLKQQVADTSNRKQITSDQLDQLKKEVSHAEAIGDFDALFIELHQREEKLQSETSDKERNVEEAGAADENANDHSNSDEDESGAETVNALKNEQEGEDEEDPEAYYRSILKKAESLSKQDDWSYVTMELDNLSRRWGEGPETDSEKVTKDYQKFTKTVEAFEERKKEHYEQLNRQKEKNLKKKKNLLGELKEIVDEEKWTATGKVNKIKGKWHSTGMLPSGEGENLDDEFEKFFGIFDDHKVDRLVQQRQEEEDNLMVKLIVLDKMENVVSSIDESTSNWKKIDEEFDDLTRQWKKIGRVPKEKSNEAWSRYKDAQDKFYDRKYKFDKEHHKQVEKFRGKKEQICREAEALLEEKDLATAARKINRLHRRWKKTGNLPQRDEDELWNRFKAATDAFNERKSDNIDKLHDQEEKHYEQKLTLIEEAEEIKGTDDWEKGHQKMQSLMDKWKAIGPVPRKKSNKIWKKFKGAMDVFYDRRRDHFKEVKEKRKDNLEEKQEILEKLQELGQHEDPIEAVNIAKPLQAEFKDAGYVPIKKKNKIWKQYRKACDVIYDRYRAAKSGNKFDQELAKADLDSSQRAKIQDMRKQYKKVKKEVHELEEEVLQFEESKTYFKPTNRGNALLDEIQKKIDRAEDKLHKKQDLLDSITKKMEHIKEEA